MARPRASRPWLIFLAAGAVVLILAGGTAAVALAPSGHDATTVAQSDPRGDSARSRADGGRGNPVTATAPGAGIAPSAAAGATPAGSVPSTAAPSSSAGGPSASGPRIEIPKIGVAARIVRLGLNEDRTLQVPRRPQDAGWWSGGALPGTRGAAVIVGHVDSIRGPGVFYRLGELRRGDQVAYVARDHSVARFVVQGVEQVSKQRFPTRRVYGRTRAATLRLVTCAGVFDRTRGHHSDNLIVYARRV